MVGNIVIDTIQECVKQTSIKLTAQLKLVDKFIEGVHFEHGHPIEIVETLSQKDKAGIEFSFKKYPLVCLFQDFVEDVSNNYIVSANLHIVICNSTKSDYKAKERYENNFKPIIYPIYDELFNQFQKNGDIIGYFPEHKKIDRLFWGKESIYGNKANIFEDYLDAVEIINLKLNLNKINC